MRNEIVISPAQFEHRDAMISLLRSEKLPTEDLSADVSNFFIAMDQGLVIGIIGLEVYGDDGLLRSLAVRPEYRNMNIGTVLVSELENQGRNLGISNFYLLTETAMEYFSKKGYEVVNRKDAPASIQGSSEFKYACPSSATLMQKCL